jgi:hypothetical protein
MRKKTVNKYREWEYKVMKEYLVNEGLNKNTLFSWIKKKAVGKLEFL